MIPNETKTKTAPEVELTDLSALTPDDRNANKGTQRGTGMLEDSLRKYGAGRSILTDKNGRIIAGNKTAEGAASIGLDEAIVVRTDGNRLVVVQRTDLDLDDPKARELAIADNRTGEINLDWNADELQALIDDGADLSEMFREEELGALLAVPPPEWKGQAVSADAVWQGMPDYEQDEQTPAKTIKVHFASVQDIESFAKAIGQPVTAHSTFIWFPQKPKAAIKSTSCRSES